MNPSLGPNLPEPYQLLGFDIWVNLKAGNDEKIWNELFFPSDKDEGENDELHEITRSYKDDTWSITIRFAAFEEATSALFVVKLHELACGVGAPIKVYVKVYVTNELSGQEVGSQNSVWGVEEE